MKHKKVREGLDERRADWDRQSPGVKSATRRPGSLNVKAGGPTKAKRTKRR